MSLAPNLASCETEPALYEQAASPPHDDVERRSSTAYSPRIARLVHLWESKGRTSDDFKVSYHQSALSPMSDHIFPQQLLFEDRGGLRRFTHGKAEVRAPLPRGVSIQQNNPLAFRSRSPQAERITPDLVKRSQDDAVSSGSVPMSVSEARRTSNHADNKQPLAKGDQDSDTRASNYGSCNSSKAYVTSITPHGEPSSAFQGQPDHRWEIQFSDPVVSLRSQMNRIDKVLEVDMLCRRNLQRSRHEIRMRECGKRVKRNVETEDTVEVNPGQSLPSLGSSETGYLRNRHIHRVGDESRIADASHSQNADERLKAQAHDSSPSSSGESRQLRCHRPSSSADATRTGMRSQTHYPDKTPFPMGAPRTRAEPTTPHAFRRCFSARRKSELSRKTRQLPQASPVGSPSTEEHLTASSEYYSLGSTGVESTQASSQANLKWTEQDTTEPVMFNAATQTDTMDHGSAETRSQWSETVSGAEHNRQGVFHRVARPIRLERRLRRATVRKVQVIVSLDGATDLALNAQVMPNGQMEGPIALEFFDRMLHG
ncbi:MAG: hypothetical protein Q9218_000918 [Villophora microphyllina]